MKKSILSIIVFIVALVFSNEVNAQKFPGLDKSPMDAASYPSSYRESDKKVKIVYSRPQLKSRSLSKLAPAGKVWRTGANEAAEITFYENLNFGGKEVKPGTYTFFTIPGEKEWTVILSTSKNVWGSYFYQESEDVVRVTGTVSKSSKSLEAFSIVFEGEDDNFSMHLGWGTTVVTIPVKG
ncbi:Protein of unknown function [Tenacibaculum sp. MAR_2009_124]|uniref:DUF2911 domain-containing protein n=1 Tax=Tenacibaculum sp. MAR_2009_124 TaxID=1250059 RepID=UPI00089A76EF|nr:DUF2911 domain-containing protein [Tenacibaculum sp. MAR_2009_124]SEC31176.1 Protein of unknown function [Tenacibaculum sp. MAR_2009_124]